MGVTSLYICCLSLPSKHSRKVYEDFRLIADDCVVYCCEAGINRMQYMTNLKHVNGVTTRLVCYIV